MQSLPSPLPQPQPHLPSVLEPHLLPSANQVGGPAWGEKEPQGGMFLCLTLSPGSQSTAEGQAGALSAAPVRDGCGTW